MASREITHKNYQAHRVNGTWNIRKDGCPVAEITVSTISRRVEDRSGEKAYKTITRSTAKVNHEVAYETFQTVNGFNVAKGEIGTLREMINVIDSGEMTRLAFREMVLAAKAAGASEFEILEAADKDNWQHAQNLKELA